MAGARTRRAVRTADCAGAGAGVVCVLWAQEAPASERSALASRLDVLLSLAARHVGGKEAHARRVAQGLLQRFLEVEERFRLGGADGPGTEQEVVDAMRKVRAWRGAGSKRPRHSTDGPPTSLPLGAFPHAEQTQATRSNEVSCVRACACVLCRAVQSVPAAAVLEAVISHQGLARKCELVSRLLAKLVLPAPTHYRSQLRRIAALAGHVKGTGQLAARAASLLVRPLPCSALGCRNYRMDLIMIFHPHRKTELIVHLFLVK